jgi:hypothetical protein
MNQDFLNEDINSYEIEISSSIEENHCSEPFQSKEDLMEAILSCYYPEDESCWDIIKKDYYTLRGFRYAGASPFEITVKNFSQYYPSNARNDVFNLLKERVSLFPFVYDIEEAEITNDTSDLDALLNCFIFEAPGEGAQDKVRGILKKWIVGSVCLWDNTLKNVQENIGLFTPLLICNKEDEIRCFYNNLLPPNMFRYFDVEYDLQDLEEKVHKNILVTVPDIDKMTTAQLFQLCYYSSVYEIDNYDFRYPLGEKHNRCASLLLTAQSIPKALNRFLGHDIVVFKVNWFHGYMFVAIDKAKAWSQAISLYKQNFDWRLTDDDKQFLKSCYNINQSK